MTTFSQQPTITRGYRTISQHPVGSGTGGEMMLVSCWSERRWHVIKANETCHYGLISSAVEFVRQQQQSVENWEVRGYFAIKQISVQTFTANVSAVYENPVNEVSVLQYLTANGPHPNVIEVTEVLTDDDNIYIIFPYCQGGELLKLVSSSRRLNERRAKNIFRDVLAGMSYMHRLGICHRDMSLENILLDENERAKIIDFGMARLVGQPQGAFLGGRVSIPPTGPCGKKRYMAPEVAMSAMSGQGYDGFKVDIWACGIVLFIMLAGDAPFSSPIPAKDESCSAIAVHRLLAVLVASWNLPVSEEAVDLIQSCLLYDPRSRPTVDQLRNHPWFAS